MISLLAQSGLDKVEPGFLHQFALLLGWGVATALGIVTLVNRNKARRVAVENQPVDVSVSGPVELRKSGQYVERNLCITLHQETDRRIGRMEADVIEMRREMKADREKFYGDMLTEVGGVHVRVNEVLVAVSELRGEIKQLGK
jgi:hypothetical protein